MTSPHLLTPTVLAAVALLIATPALADVPPWPTPVENARVTREQLSNHPDIHQFRICVEGPLPSEGFDARYIEINLLRSKPLLDVLLRPTVGADGRVCAEVRTAIAVEQEMDINIRDVRPTHQPVWYYLGPLMAIPDKAAGP